MGNSSHIDKDGRHRQLEDHLRAVAQTASENAAPFEAGDWARTAGLWHDLGKYQPPWQSYLRSHHTGDPHDAEPRGKVPHALAGAQYAERELGSLGRLLAYVIAGHHAGLPDFHSDDGGLGSLRLRLAEASSNPKRDELTAAFGNAEAIPPDILAKPSLAPDSRMDSRAKGSELALSLWLRMLFSCLVDADFLDAEAFLNPQQHAQRPALPKAADLLSTFNAYMAHKTADAAANPSPVNTARAQVLTACRSSGQAPRFASGIYSLTVPTGGGKTLASLAFALEHAKAHGKQRVIYGIPFTSIIEQTAGVFREAFADNPDCVIEHHSNLDPAKASGTSHLATENWDAPLIVTTNVQLFESLFAAKTSRCRKLHSLVNSVIVLDEAQQLPPAYLAPITQALRLLAQHYGVTVLLCTATQPNLQGQTDAFGRSAFPGIGAVQEIIANPAGLYATLKRVEVTLPKADDARTSWEALAQSLHMHDCALTIVNTRQDARDLYSALGEDSGRVHLSARMCPQHRADVIADIKQRLQARRTGEITTPLRVVSTTLVEAGVDLDFPVVYRSLAGLDSIAQAAGRCNREGRLAGMGQVVVFRPEKERGKGLMQEARQAAAELIDGGLVTDALAPETFALYFNKLYGELQRNNGGKGLDAKEIVRLLTPDGKDCAISFRTAAERFKLIDEEGQHSVVVRYARDEAMRNDFETALGALAKDPTARWAYRQLQRFTVSVPEHEFKRMEQMVEPIAGLLVVQEGWYDPAFGLRSPDEAMSATSLCPS
ncbi:MAG: CRISPR-associated helicase Cas3' [Stagnimonas sp.]|nr:CRISPR-associated helicase Cas3' [Stagnimonas sp.]